MLNGITNGYVHYAYDAVGNLAHAEYADGSCEYKMPDALGNIYRNKDHSDREYSAGGKLLRDSQYNYFYDGEGNLTLKTRRKTPGIASLDYIPPRRWGMEEDLRYVPPKKYTEEEKKALLASWESERIHPIWKWGDYAYSWFGNGMLKSVKLPDSSLVTFEYDALGRRTAKVGGKQINRYFWDGNVLLHEWKYDKSERPAAVADELGALKVMNQEPVPDVVTWMYEYGSYVPSAKLLNEQRYSIVSDYLGRPVQAYSDRGQLVWQTDYDIYGGLRNLEGEREFIPFRQLGQYEDEETGLYYNRFRWYDSNTGNYISQDPIGLEGGNPTFYGYVKDINIWIDIWGLEILYRLLRSDENIAEGLTAKKTDRGMTIHGHVSSGSRNKGSQFISTSKDPVYLADKWHQSGQVMVAIDTDKLGSDVQVIDISTREKAIAAGVGSGSASFPAKSKEVLLVGHVPSSAMEEVDANKFKTCH